MVTEVGSKDKNDIMPLSKWVEEIKSDLDKEHGKLLQKAENLGTLVFTERLRSKSGLIKDMLNANIDMHKVIFEAPQRKQQIWFIKI